MGDGRIFLESLRDASFNKDLSNAPTFGRIISLDSTFKKHPSSSGNKIQGQLVCSLAGKPSH
jgi:hypothetical protein